MTLLKISRCSLPCELVLLWMQKNCFLAWNTPFTGLFCTSGLRQAPLFPHMLCTLSADCYSIVAQILVCCSQGRRIFLVDYCDTKGFLFGNSPGSSLILGVKNVSFRSIFSGVISHNILCTNSAQFRGIGSSHIKVTAKKLPSNKTLY